MLQTIDSLSELLDPYDKCQHLECDGLSRVISKVLTDAEIKNQLHIGQVKHQNTKKIVSPHYWIELQLQNYIYVIDYHCRRWLGDSNEIPHGCFLSSEYSLTIYKGKILYEKAITSKIFNILITPFPNCSFTTVTQNN